MTPIYPKEVCSKCGNYMDDDLKCYECEICNGEINVEDSVTVTSDTTFDHLEGSFIRNPECDPVGKPPHLDFKGKYDPVNQPPHYLLSGGIECIDYMRQILGLQGFIDYCHGNVIKYQHRYKYKGKPVQDMEKAQYYLNKMIEAMKEKHK